MAPAKLVNIAVDLRGIMRAKVSSCGRFVVVDGLHLDRKVFQRLERWAADYGLTMQDAIQLSMCALQDECRETTASPSAPPGPVVRVE